ncbi:cyclase family protein [Leadbettera azotonutricia]|uniref:Cyclase family protein n=1 Tax=Leadbettera azotonutricia (strain ATCC BAA-888 / DSM 13862 / ZAS-9) TaxID=545695 RepID=F5Y7I3_LEAAZ|nr:cyclase family protein [Leadbettera azotonutricia]AEF82846.1 cyclase family protein [Leadbettera azotonutricia ZAS-9]
MGEAGEMESLPEILAGIMDSAEIVDLSYTLESGMPAWPTQARYGSVVYESYDSGNAALHSMIVMSEHTGTHIDAPKHFIPHACPIDELPVKTVMGRGVRIDALNLPARGLFDENAVKAFEQKNGEINKGDIVMFRFGWDDKYRIQPNSAEYLKDWPGISKGCAEYLAEKGIKAAGCDCLAIDAFGSADEAHYVLLGKGIPIIENIKNLKVLPVFFYVIGLPNKFKGGSGSPIRLIAITGKKA